MRRVNELGLEEIIQLSGLKPTNSIVSHNVKELIPRRIPSNYIEEINWFSEENDNLLYCVSLEIPFKHNGNKVIKRIYYEPSAVLLATMLREDKEGIKEMLGWKDGGWREKSEITEIIDYLEGGSVVKKLRNVIRSHNDLPKSELEYLKAVIREHAHIEKKRLENLTKMYLVDKIYFCGNAYDAVVRSKKDKGKKYVIKGKQLITFNGVKLNVPYSYTYRCSCGLSENSTLKYEFDEIVCDDIHEQRVRQGFADHSFVKEVEKYEKKGGKKINEPFNNLFTPFNLDYPSKSSKSLRRIIRRVAYLYIVPQDYIIKNYNDKAHKSNGFTLFRCEADALLLSFREVFNKDFLRLWESNNNKKLSEEKTCKFFADYSVKGYKRVNAEHEYNENKQCLDHLVNNNWMHVVHFNDELELLNNDEFKHVKKGSEWEHDNEIFHYLEVYESFRNYSKPFNWALTPEGIQIGITPYKMRKSKTT